MAINYAKRQYDKLTMNWDILFDYFNQFDIFYSQKLQVNFLLEWKNRILKSERNAEYQFQSLDLNNMEHFPIRLVFNGNFLGWSAINIDLIEHLIYLAQRLPTTVPNNLFTLETEHLERYNLQPTNRFLYQPSHRSSTKIDMPILIFAPSSFSFGPRVIDGNNRVHFAIRNDIKEIPAYLLTENFFIAHPEVFLEDFCKDIFFFLSDLHWFIDNKRKKSFFQKFNDRKESIFMASNSLLYNKLS